MIKKVFLLCPDSGSGKAFEKVLNKNNIETVNKFYRIAPRVLNNVLNTSNDVTSGLTASLIDAAKYNLPIVIACNTLQFWIPKVNKNIINNKIITTFESAEWKFKEYKNKPVWIGTTPTSRLIKYFPTLVSLGFEDIQTKTQELTWRVKKYFNDDILTAPEFIIKETNNKFTQIIKIYFLKLNIILFLRKNGIKNVILGCTEYPTVFKNRNEFGINFFDPAEIVAEYINTSKKIVFEV